MVRRDRRFESVRGLLISRERRILWFRHAPVWSLWGLAAVIGGSVGLALADVTLSETALSQLEEAPMAPHEDESRKDKPGSEASDASDSAVS